MVLDLSEPWRVVPLALDALRPGGILACYSPSIIQVQRTVEALEATRGVRPDRVAGGAVPALADQGAGRAAGPADGEPHGVPDVRAAAGRARRPPRGRGHWSGRRPSSPSTWTCRLTPIRRPCCPGRAAAGAVRASQAIAGRLPVLARTIRPNRAASGGRGDVGSETGRAGRRPQSGARLRRDGRRRRRTGPRRLHLRPGGRPPIAMGGWWTVFAAAA